MNTRDTYSLLNQKFGRLTVVAWGGTNSKRETLWVCLCNCGNKLWATKYRLTSGESKSCGCLRKELTRTLRNRFPPKRKNGLPLHNMSRTHIYQIWSSMWARCTNPNEPSYPSYGGRGIRVCEEWRDFAKFYEDMGDRPKYKTLDRIDNNGGYCKSNCRWASIPQQNTNRRNNHLITVGGETLCITYWALLLGTTSSTILRRMYNGMSEAEAVRTPLRTKKRASVA